MAGRASRGHPTGNLGAGDVLVEMLEQFPGRERLRVADQQVKPAVFLEAVAPVQTAAPRPHVAHGEGLDRAYVTGHPQRYGRLGFDFVPAANHRPGHAPDQWHGAQCGAQSAQQSLGTARIVLCGEENGQHGELTAKRVESFLGRLGRSRFGPGAEHQSSGCLHFSVSLPARSPLTRAASTGPAVQSGFTSVLMR